jgi:hypothetical protein
MFKSFTTAFTAYTIGMIALFLMGATTSADPTHIAYLGAAAILMVGAVPLALVGFTNRQRSVVADGRRPNPWEIQQHLMRISDQKTPSTPRITHTALLYYALILEEASEAGEGLMNVLADYLEGEQDGERTVAAQLEFNALAKISRTIHASQMSMHFESTALRNLLKAELPASWQGMPLTISQAKKLGDDTTNITVVNCGFCLGLGLPGQLMYDDVSGSNLSKANPSTGIIDKDGSCKWIKGANFKEPNIALLLRRYFPDGTFPSEDEQKGADGK